jgi:hypothetical protein
MKKQAAARRRSASGGQGRIKEKRKAIYKLYIQCKMTNRQGKRIKNSEVDNLGIGSRNKEEE